MGTRNIKVKFHIIISWISSIRTWLFWMINRNLFFSKNVRHFFSRSRMKKIVSAFESNMSQLLQTFWFFRWFLSSEISKKCHFTSPKMDFLQLWGVLKPFFSISLSKKHAFSLKMFSEHYVLGKWTSKCRIFAPQLSKLNFSIRI